jgi:hypothetical protein
MGAITNDKWISDRPTSAPLVPAGTFHSGTDIVPPGTFH